MKHLSCCAVLGWLVGAWAAHAEVYPTHPLTIIVPVSPGGPTDAIARILAERMRTLLGQMVLVENVTGAAGNLALRRVVHAAPDGYTMMIGHTSTHVFNGAIYKLPFDVVKDFEPIGLIASNPQLIVSKKSIPARDLRGLIAWLKANPGQATMATIGPGSPAHIAAVLFENITGTRFQFVPYRGGAPGMRDLLAGQIDLMIPQPSLALPHMRAGKINAYVVSARRRLDAAPDIPSADEAGVPGFYTSIWHAFWAPKKTPKEVVAKLNAAVMEALADPAVRRRLNDMGQDIPPPKRQTPAALIAYQKAEIAKWWPIIRAAHIKAL